MHIRKGTLISTVKGIRPWAPFRLHRIPAGTVGVVKSLHIDVHPTFGKDIEMLYADVLFKWIDKKGHRKSARTAVWVDRERRGKGFKIIKF